jgi:hypothetical protein
MERLSSEATLASLFDDAPMIYNVSEEQVSAALPKHGRTSSHHCTG